MNPLRFFSPLWLVERCTCWFSSSKSSQASSTSTSSTVYDDRIALADEAIYAAGGTVDKSITDARSFDDHSSFGIEANQTDNSVKDSGNTSIDSRQFTDSRNLSDNSVFSIDAHQANTTTDSSTTNTTTNISSSDPGTLKELAKGAFSAAELSTNKGSEMLSAVLNYGAKLTTQANEGVAADRNFASGLVSSVIETTKSADQQNTEKIVKAATYLGGAALAAFAVINVVRAWKGKAA